MKQIHKKIAATKAARLGRLLKDIRSLKKGRKLRKAHHTLPAHWACCGGIRKQMRDNQAVWYIPLDLANATRRFTNLQKARLLDIAIRHDQEYFLGYRDERGRAVRLDGNSHVVKDRLCFEVFHYMAR